MRTRKFTFGREFRQDTSERDPGTRKNKTNAIKGVVKSGWINTHFPFDQGSNAVQSLELNFCFSHFDFFVHILPSSFLFG
jgi:hypothetical protein